MINSMLSTLPGHSQLRRLLNLRSLAVGAQLLTLLAVRVGLDMQLEWTPMLVTIATLATFNLFSLLRLKSDKPVSNLELFVQSAVDVLALSILLYYAGGSTNPFVSLYLLPLVIVAATLPPRLTWGMAALTTACYSLLMVYYLPLPHNHHDMAGMDMAGHDMASMDMAMSMPMEMEMESAFNTHVLGMWLGFVISAVVVAYFVVKMAQAIRSRDELLTQVREEVLRNERIVALGTQAAGAAHELGTPLSTMAVVIGELQHDHAADAELRDSLTLLDEQVRNCRRILDKILLNAQDSGSSSLQAADQLMAEVLDEWQLLRPSAQYHYAPSAMPPPLLTVDVTLRAALLNLLNNAADASSQLIEIIAHWDDRTFTLQIHDRGAGLSEEVALKAGSAFFTTKTEGRGLGLFLANATLERLGGTVRLFNRASGGATTELTLPIARPVHAATKT
ncbi:MAG: ATP-binding protein [Gallionella sp.]|nr:ATP-binding protein [Gallionella sp.]MDD4945676.1 ATP-binding protein [Gallionella sp.]MDD5611634.1 ATP-binding protein [Gallionella sp.]